MWTRARGLLERGVRAFQAVGQSPAGLVAALSVLMIPYVYFSLSLDPAWPVAAPNAGAWTERGTLAFERPGRALTPAPPPWLDWVTRTNRLQFDLELRPTADRGATILTISSDTHARNLVIEQRGDGVVVRLATACTGVLGNRPCDATLFLRGVLQPSAWTDLRVRIEPGRLDLRVDGQRGSRDLGPLPLSLWDDGYRLALGNEVNGARPWRGEIAEATIRTPGFVADYIDPARLEVATELRSWDRIKLVPFASFAPDDVARNAIMYVPMGVAFALLGLFPGRRGAGRAILTMGLVSFGMETLQVFLPERTPSVNDLILNTLGGAVGFLVVRWLLARMSRAHRLPVGSAAADR